MTEQVSHLIYPELRGETMYYLFSQFLEHWTANCELILEPREEGIHGLVSGQWNVSKCCEERRHNQYNRVLRTGLAPGIVFYLSHQFPIQFLKKCKLNAENK